MYLIWILESKLILSNYQSRATLWVLETCLTVGLLPFMTILITASLSSNTYNKASWCKNWTFEWIISTLSKSLIILWDCFRFWIVWSVERTSRLFTNKSPCSLWLWFVFPRTATIRSHKSSAVIPSNLNPASKDMISDSVEIVRNWSLLLTHPTYRNECMTSKNAQCSTLYRFWISCKIGVLKQSQSVLFGGVSHMAILFVFTCMVNVRGQTT